MKNKPRVLIIDDERSIRITFREFLREEGYEVTVAEDGRVALDYLNSKSFDVVISDIIMPAMTGLDILRMIRETDDEVQVVLMTGEPNVETASEAVRNSAFEYLAKPISKSELLRAVRNAARIKSSMDESRRLREENKRYAENLEKLVEERTRSLADSVDRYRNLFENSLDMIQILDLEGRIADVNQAKARTLGYSREEMVGKPFMEFVHPDFRSRAETIFSRCIQGETIRFHESCLLTINRRKVFVEIAAVPLITDGIVASIQQTFRNITERKLTSEKLEVSENQYQSIVQDLPVLLCRFQPGGKILFVNDAFCINFGQRSEDLIGRGLFQLLAPEKESDLEDQLASMTPESAITNLEIHSIDRSGKTRWMNWTIRGIFNSNNLTCLYQAFGVDITGQKMALENLRDSELRFRSIAEQSLVGIYLLEDGCFVYVNDVVSRITGYSSDELLKMNRARVLEMVHPEDRSKVEAQITTRQDNQSEIQAQYEFRWIHASGETRWLNLFSNRFRLNDKPTISAVVVDITERKEAEEEHRKTVEQLVQAQKMEGVGQLAGGIAHDFNNLLQSILGYSDMMLSELTLEDSARSDLEEVHRAAERAISLTRQLLTFSRRQLTHPEDLILDDLIEDLLKMLRRLIGANIELQFINEDSPGTLFADPGQMEQILINLCVNARDAMPRGGSITIETKKEKLGIEEVETHEWAKPGDYTLLRISDTGKGISPEIITKIFEPFFTTKALGKGTGLGLSTVYGIVKHHNGLMNVISEPGKGTEFRIHFPIVNRSVVKPETRLPEQPPRGTETILIAEDEPTVQEIGTKYLRKAGYRVITANDGKEALERFEEHSDEIDLALLDVIMPIMNGPDVMEAIVRKGDTRVKFLFASGYTGDYLDREFEIDENLQLIHKPYSSKVLLSRIRLILDEDSTVQESLERIQGKERIEDETEIDNLRDQVRSRVDRRNGSSILLVDDDTQVLGMYKKVLERAGYLVRTAENGIQALDSFRKHPTELVITDIIMPEKDGMETIMRLRQENPEVKIIAITSGGRFGSESYLKVAESLGTDCTFQKPIRTRELLAAIANLIR